MTNPLEPARLFICHGPPLCLLEYEDAIEAQEKGCPFCRVEQYDPIADKWAVVQDPKEN